jgi:predicted  nucleic acid-binding Zn-ribbon protein
MGLMQRLFGPKRIDEPEIRTISDWDSIPVTPGEPREAGGPGGSAGGQTRTVLIDSPDSGPEVAELKPIGVVVPRNKQELMEELRKNYADVIELVRKVNIHLDEQSSRLAEQESRGREMIEIARQIPALLSALPKLAEQNTQLLGLVERLANESASGNEALRSALAEQAEATAKSGRDLAGAIDAAKANIAGGVRDAAAAHGRTGEALGAQLTSVRTATEANAASFEAARVQLEARADDLRKAMRQHQKWSLVATIIGLVAIVATGVVGVVLFTHT